MVGMRVWPALGPVGVLLVESRGFVTTPSLSKAQQHAPDAATVDYVHDNVAGLLIGMGVSFLGMACIVVFVAGLANHVWSKTSQRVAVLVMLVGVAATAGAVLVGYGMMVVLAAASDESSPDTVAAVYIVVDSLGYVAWTAMGLVSGAAAVVYWTGTFGSRWIGWFSAVITVIFVVTAFLPFFSWAPAMLWVFVVGLGLTLTRAKPTLSTS